jgi:hypothetical protein
MLQLSLRRDKAQSRDSRHRPTRSRTSRAVSIGNAWLRQGLVMMPLLARETLL